MYSCNSTQPSMASTLTTLPGSGGEYRYHSIESRKTRKAAADKLMRRLSNLFLSLDCFLEFVSFQYVLYFHNSSLHLFCLTFGRVSEQRNEQRSKVWDERTCEWREETDEIAMELYGRDWREDETLMKGRMDGLTNVGMDE